MLTMMVLGGMHWESLVLVCDSTPAAGSQGYVYLQRMKSSLWSG